MATALFEDSRWRNFAPISLTKATFDIKVGAKNFFEEYQPAPQTLLTREYLAHVTAEQHADCEVNPSSIDSDTLFINGLLHPAALFHFDRLLTAARTFAITSSRSSTLLIAKLDSRGIEYLQDCVNLGAMTSTSDLKMTYGNIKMTAGKFKVDTGHNKMGSFIADMVKTSIGTLIYSGRRIGVSSHLHGLVAND